jgi:hypothetical protein
VRIIASAVVAFAVLVAGHSVVAAEPPTAIAAEAKFLPDNCQLLGVVRVEQLLKSPAFQLLVKEAPLVAREEKAIAANLPLPLDQIDRIVLGGGVMGEEEGLFVIRTRATILPETVAWSTSRVDPPKKVKVGKDDKYDLYQRRHESYCVVGENLLVFGKESALRAVLARDAAPALSAHLATALKDADLMATVAFALDVESVRNKRRSEPAPFIPGLQVARVEAATDSLALTVKFGDQIEVSAVARATAADKSEKLTDEAKAFAAFHQTSLKRDRGVPDEVLDIFKFNVAVEGKRVTASTKCTAAAVVRLLKSLSQ